MHDLSMPIRALRPRIGLWAKLCIAVFLCAAVGAPTTAALAASSSHGVSSGIARSLNDAMKAINDKEYDKALEKVDKADGESHKTPYEQFKIDQFRAILYLSEEKELPRVLELNERMLTTPDFFDPEGFDSTLLQTVQLALQTQQFDKVQQYGNQYLAAHPGDTQVMDLMARGSYISKDYKTAQATLRKLIDTTEAAGKQPQELWLQLLASCAGLLDEQQEYVADYEKLVMLYPKPQHWAKLFERIAQTQSGDYAMLELYRLMDDVGVLSTADQYMDYSKVASDKAFPVESVHVLQAGIDKKILDTSGKDGERYRQALAEAKKKAASDLAELPKYEKDFAAKKQTNGQSAVGLGLAYFAYGMNDKAIARLSEGLSQGGLVNGDEARMALGIAYWRTGQKDKAREQFDAVPATSPMATVAKLWSIRTHN